MENFLNKFNLRIKLQNLLPHKHYFEMSLDKMLHGQVSTHINSQRWSVHILASVLLENRRVQDYARTASEKLLITYHHRQQEFIFLSTHLLPLMNRD